MKKIILILTIIFSAISGMYSQNIDTLIFCDYKIIPFQYEYKNTKVEEISGIDYAGTPGKYFLLPQSDNNPHYYLCTIEEKNKQMYWYIDSIIPLKAKSFDGESIRLNHKTGEIFLNEELLKRSFLKKIDSKDNIKTVLQSDSFQKVNRGWEGMAFDNDFKNIYISVEQTNNKPITYILKYNIKTKKTDTLIYKLDVLPNDSRNDNGITEILYAGKNMLLVLERDWQKSTKHTAVRVYKCKIDLLKKEVSKIKCIVNFDTLYFKPDNVEGMTFNADRSKIIFVTDNNKNKHQQTQLICFKIK